jgi:hypothetical protein
LLRKEDDISEITIQTVVNLTATRITARIKHIREILIQVKETGAMTGGKTDMTGGIATTKETILGADLMTEDIVTMALAWKDIAILPSIGEDTDTNCFFASMAIKN